MKKKFKDREVLSGNFLRQLFFIMKLTLFFLITSTLGLFATGSYSQNTRITLDLRSIPVREALKAIENESEFFFIYNNELIDVDRDIDLSVKNQKITEVLNNIFEGRDVEITVIDRKIVLAPAFMGEQQPTKKITGIVTDQSGATLPGVSVVVKGTTAGVITDNDGKFSLGLSAEAKVLVFSFVGMKTQEFAIEGKTTINVKLEEETIGIEEVVAIGYGTQKKSDLTGSVNRVEAKMLKSQTETQLTDMISGSVAGFYVKQGTSASGDAGTLEIRGQNSILANSDPLIVLDGVIYNGNIADINPNDIATIDILKDASATAVFGARSASGVVIVTTNKGKTGKPKIGFTTSFGLTESTRKILPFEGGGFLNFRRDFLESSVPKSPYYYYNPAELPNNISVDQWRQYSANPNADNTQEWLGRLLFTSIEAKNYLAGNTIDWYNEVMQKGIRQNYDFNISGGTNDVSYYWSLGYLNNEGIIVGDKFSTIRSKLNIDIKVADYINIGLNTQFSNSNQGSVTASLSSMYICSPYGNKYNEDGSLTYFPNGLINAQNPFMNYYYNDILNTTNSLFSSLYAQIKLPFGFSYRLSYQPRFSFAQDYSFKPTTTSSGSGSRSDSKTLEWTIDNLIKWNKKIGMHDFDLTLLYSFEKNQLWNSNSANLNFSPNDNLSYHGLQYGINPSVSSNDTYATGDAAMARLNYTFSGKYLLTGSVRRDGYSAFGQKNPRAIFPAAALAWQLGKEDFFKVDWINQMKLRFSWGINGNRDIGIYSALSTLSSNNYYNGSGAVVGVTTSKLANPNLVWEKTQANNIGMDIGLFKDRINISADYYISTTKDLLMNRRLPVITGFDNMTVNLGELANHGFEMTLNTVNFSTPNFNWKTNLVFSLNRNEIVKLYGDYRTYVLKGDTITGEEVPDYVNHWFPGHSIDAVWDYKVVGVWQLNEAAEAARVGLKPGDYKVEDVNGDGLYTELDDKQFLGYTTPRYNIGIRNDFTFLKNFTASVFIRADLGQISALAIAKHTGNEIYDRINSRAVPYWTQYNPEPVWGRLNVYEGVYAGGYNVYFPRSFVRIQDLSLSYSFPQAVVQRMKISNLRIFGSVRNLYSFDKWKDFDPESGGSPMPRTCTFGLSFEL